MFWFHKASREGSAVERERGVEIAALEHQLKALTLKAEIEEVKARTEKAKTERTRERVGKVKAWIFLDDGKGKGLSLIGKALYVLAGAGAHDAIGRMLQALLGGH